MQAGVPGHPLDSRLAHVAHTAVELNATVEHPVDQLAHESLHHGNLPDRPLALIQQPCRVIEELPPGLHRRSKPAGLFERCRKVVRKGRYRGPTFLEVEAKTIINRVPYTKYFPFEYTINCYRGCSHACVYCVARPTHDYLGLDIGKDFDRKIVVKINAVELTMAQTAPRHWAGQSIAMGTNTDPYQPAESRYRLTRGVVQVLSERANPFSLLTKSPLVLRDRHLLADAARRADITVQLLGGHPGHRCLEEFRAGHSPSPAALGSCPKAERTGDSIRRAGGASSPRHLRLAPPVGRSYESLPGCGRRFRRSHPPPPSARRQGALHEWLQEEFPDLVGTYQELYRNRSYLPRQGRLL